MLFAAALAAVLLAAPLPGEREEYTMAPEMDLEAAGRGPKGLECTTHAGVVQGFDYAEGSGDELPASDELLARFAQDRLSDRR